MTMIAAEGFVHFQSLADWGAKGNTGGTNVTFSSSSGRGGRGGVTNGLNANTYKVLPVSSVVVFDHRAIYTNDRTNCELIAFRNGSDTHCWARSLTDGTIEFRRASSPFSTLLSFATAGTTILGYSNPGVIRQQVQHQLQTKFKVDGAAGVFEMYVDGVLAFSFTGNTYGAGAVGVTMSGFGTNATGSGVTVSDWVVFNDQGSFNNTYGGDLAVYENVQPVDGDEKVWTRSSGAGTWSSHVNQNPQDGDTTYLSSAANGDRVCFSFPTVSSALGTIVAVKETVCHRKEDASLGLIQLYSRSDDAVDHNGATIACTQSYKFDERIYERDQKDGSAWTPAKATATQLGIYNAS